LDEIKECPQKMLRGIAQEEILTYHFFGGPSIGIREPIKRHAFAW